MQTDTSSWPDELPPPPDSCDEGYIFDGMLYAYNDKELFRWSYPEWIKMELQ
jgi:hypothetical protein